MGMHLPCGGDEMSSYFLMATAFMLLLPRDIPQRLRFGAAVVIFAVVAGVNSVVVGVN